jgi:hypothetical protein
MSRDYRQTLMAWATTICVAGLGLLPYAAQLLPDSQPVGVSQRASGVEQILGQTGSYDDGVLCVLYPRGDLSVKIGPHDIPPALGLTSWSRWKRMGESTLLVGEFVLLPAEVEPFVAALQSGEITVRGLNNRFLGEKPRLIFLQLMGVGRPDSLATALRYALSKTATPQTPSPLPSPGPLQLDTARLNTIFARPGCIDGGVYRQCLARSGVQARGEPLTGALGLESWVGISGSDQNCVVVGQLALTTGEIAGVTQKLLAGNLRITAVHGGPLDEQPRILFLYFVAAGNAQRLAASLAPLLDIVGQPAR